MDAGAATYFLDGTAWVDVQVYVWDTANEIAVVFRGTDGKRDVTADLDQRTVELTDVPRVGKGSVCVHRGFHRQFTVVREDLRRTLIRCDAGRRKRLLFTGHSLGGAVATVAAVCLGNEPWTAGSSVEVHTFGSPRVGNAGFVRAFDAVVGSSIRVFHEGDPVSMMPTKSPFQHVSGGMRLPSFASIEDLEPDVWGFSLLRAALLFLSAVRYDNAMDNHACTGYQRAFDPPAPVGGG